MRCSGRADEGRSAVPTGDSGHWLSAKTNQASWWAVKNQVQAQGVTSELAGRMSAIKAGQQFPGVEVHVSKRGQQKEKPLRRCGI
ncbi:hypothetical protein HPP92_004690 [Vanilla planifolia]|uniref:Uncharacterized protein n=1 Tax=Vanilla planifolia TaxID=51239 RepID=A0A835RSK7_VANPL|nr:hypothetical protein HPP92_004690 [Vanilla planifolia]